MAIQVLINTKEDLVVKAVSEYNANNQAPNITFALGTRDIDGANLVPTSYSIRGIEFNMSDGGGSVQVYRANSSSNTLIYTLDGQGVFDIQNFSHVDNFKSDQAISVTANGTPSHAYTAIFYLKKGY